MLLRRGQFIKTLVLGVVTSGIGRNRLTRHILGEAQAADIPFPVGQFTFKVSDHPELASDLGSISLEVPGLPNILVTRLAAGQFVAVTSVCTHEGCGVQPYSGLFAGMHCPCHRSLFAPDGSVIHGPASEPLYRYKLAYDGQDSITLDLVKFSYLISAQLAPVTLHGHKRLAITFQTEPQNNYVIMFKPTLDATDWTQIMFSETEGDDAAEDMFFGTGESVTLYVDLAERTGIYTVARYHLLGG